jgi:peptide/nickel transport system ATP-binding protein
VLEKGRIVETGESEQIFKRPQMSYTKKLISSITHLDVEKELVDSR